MNKILSKFLAVACIVVAVSGVLVAPASALSLDDAWMKVVNAIGVAQRAESNDSDCLNLRYVGASTQSIVAVTPTAISAYAPFNVADTSFGSSGSYDLTAAAYDTMGELCDAIDGLSDYTCQLLGCKRDDDSQILRDRAAKAGDQELQRPESGYTAKIDSGASSVDGAPQGFVIRVGVQPATGRRVVVKKIVANANVAGSLQVFGKLRKYAGADDGVTRNDTTKVWQSALADDTDSTVDFTVNGSVGLEFAEGEHVVMSAGNGTGIQAAANFLSAIWEER